MRREREKNAAKQLFDHNAKKIVFVMQVHELDYVFVSPRRRNAFDSTHKSNSIECDE